VEPFPIGSGTLAVQIEGLRNSEGTIHIGLFDGPAGFPQDTAAMVRSATRVLAEVGERVIRFEGLAYGEYAVAVLHDENASGAMDTNFLGIPKEGLGFSNNPRIVFGAPSFESCSVRFDEPEMALQLQMRYF
jgi:uncharacterized protein (DUF2141 family)